MKTQTTLYYNEGSSDKVYQASIETKGDGCIVHFAYGRRGNTLQTGVKTPQPVPIGDAHRIFDQLIREKISKGYRAGENGESLTKTEKDGTDSGIRCQLLNPVDQEEMEKLLLDSSWCLQQKYDGRRMLIQKIGNAVTGINRRGMITGVPEPIVQAALETPFDFLIDGEAVGSTLHAFDLLEYRETDYRGDFYMNRLTRLVRMLDGHDGAIRVVATAFQRGEKREMYQSLRLNHAEGIVLKKLESHATPGRPASGGSQLKFKFVETASFIVRSINKKRSVELGLLNERGEEVSAGNVTIPANRTIPAIGSVVEVQYLYAFRESGSVYQPLYRNERDDIDVRNCRVSQLKYKADGCLAVR